MITIDKVGDTGWVVTHLAVRPPDRTIFVCVNDIIAHVTDLLNEQARDMAVHCSNGVHTCPTCIKLVDPPTEDPNE